MANNLAAYALPPAIVAAIAARVEGAQHGGFHQEGPPIEPPIPINPRDRNREWTENGTFISHLITPEAAAVRTWIAQWIPPQGPIIVGMSVEHNAETARDEQAEVITLYVPGRCLTYQVSGRRISNEMLDLLNNHRCTFVGKKSGHGIKDMQGLINKKQREDSMAVGGTVPTVTMQNMLECGPAEMYLEEARQLVMRHAIEEVPFNWKARVLPPEQARYTCQHALVGWLFAHGRPPQLP